MIETIDPKIINIDNNEYLMVDGVITKDGLAVDGVLLHDRKIYNDGILVDSTDYHLYNDILYEGSSISNNYVLFNNTLYFNGNKDVGYSAPIYKDGSNSNKYNGSILYKDGSVVNDDDELYLLGNTLYKGRTYNIGYILFNGSLFNNTSLNTGYIIYDNILYDGHIPNEGCIIYNDKLYNGTSLYSGYHDYGRKVYYNGVLNESEQSYSFVYPGTNDIIYYENEYLWYGDDVNTRKKVYPVPLVHMFHIGSDWSTSAVHNGLEGIYISFEINALENRRYYNLKQLHDLTQIVQSGSNCFVDKANTAYTMLTTIDWIDSNYLSNIGVDVSNGNTVGVNYSFTVGYSGNTMGIFLMENGSSDTTLDPNGYRSDDIRRSVNDSYNTWEWCSRA